VSVQYNVPTPLTPKKAPQVPPVQEVGPESRYAFEERNFFDLYGNWTAISGLSRPLSSHYIDSAVPTPSYSVIMFINRQFFNWLVY